MLMGKHNLPVNNLPAHFEPDHISTCRLCADINIELVAHFDLCIFCHNRT